MPMNPELKAKWVAALRSGDYKQTKGCLKGHGGHCCLGVLCEVKGFPQGKPHDNGDVPFVFADKLLGGERTATIPAQDSVEMGIPAYTRDTLAEMNDNQGKTFSEIADYIESHL